MKYWLQGKRGGTMAFMVIAALVASGGAVALGRTKTGRLLRAVAEDPRTTLLMGGDTARAVPQSPQNAWRRLLPLSAVFT